MLIVLMPFLNHYVGALFGQRGNMRPREKDGGGEKRDAAMRRDPDKNRKIGFPDNRSGKEVSRYNSTTGEETNDGATILHTLVLETPASGPRAGVRPRVTDSGGGKDDNQDNGAMD